MPEQCPSLASKLTDLVRLIAIAAILAFAGAPAARADTFSGFLSRGHLWGQFRSYYFRRDYGATSAVNADAFAVAGLFNYRTPRFLGGFSLEASYFTANALGSHATDPARIDLTLSGRANSINALGQAYLQYTGHGALLRLGDQVLATPWAGPSDSRVLPETYQAGYAVLTPTRDLRLSALWILRHRGRTSDGYFRDNNYYPPAWHGDANYGVLGNLPADAPGSAGTVAAGAGYERDGLKITGWYYDFHDFAHLLYAQVQETLASNRPIEPFAGVQVVREWGATNIFAITGTHLLGQPGTAVSNFTLGGIVGVMAYGARLSVAFDRMRERSGALGGGALVSPYTQNFATDPLYTSSMIRGMVELGPGSAWKVTAGGRLLGERLELTASFAEYHAAFNGDDSETYLDVIYRPRGYLQNLSLRDRMEISSGRVNPGHRDFLYNRVMIAYRF